MDTRLDLLFLLHLPFQVIQKSSSLCITGQSGGTGSYLLVGLGGGLFATCLQGLFRALSLSVCEIDGEMENVAREYFGFRSTTRTKVVIQDGVDYLSSLHNAGAGESDKAALGEGHFDVIFLDVDSQDPSLGMSAPPAAFITIDALENAWKALVYGGLLLINVVSREHDAFRSLQSKLTDLFTLRGSGGHRTLDQSMYGAVYCLRPSDEYTNVLLLAVKELSADGVLEDSVNERTLVEELWLGKLSEILGQVEVKEIMSRIECVTANVAKT